MSKIDRVLNFVADYLGFIIASVMVAVILLAILGTALAADSTSRIELDDKCFVIEHVDRRLFGETTTESNIYCKVPDVG